MAAEKCALLRQVGIDVEHPAVIVPQQPKPVVLHHVRHARRFDPCVNFAPRHRIVFQQTRTWKNGIRQR